MRSAEFDRKDVLRSAMDAFVTKGYAKTSMQDLKAVTGLHPGSIYCAFENKRGLLIAALEQYRDDKKRDFQTLFESQTSVMAGFEMYLNWVLEECETEEIKDCLLQKSLSEMAQQDDEVERLISMMLQDWHQSIEDKIALAQQAGEASLHKSATQLAQFLVMGIYGIRTLSHTQPKPGVLRELKDELLDYIKA
ncbi:TetR/AcrR family transcriptional regulator [Vibrio sp. Isolate25]|uniref:TetR/AcrR family transcriptional regulator n=1 Tax=Vibrio TaxID=662 RepID=UPI001EFD432F|nr:MULTISPECIES: TetR/AcrR family transcriptional regulator [Vibrio]MCG9596897.1 TetR/AcrR family transcriptional regulator [Vibrio sp. Isolate25]MCG9679835.1 TetR/AcrR family transcriptional regulator [Vibrio sp. Isolate24]USD33530.1 TetR/AcrR family transcriptional regulator [Vibrio sp. SCSIO 43186]USD47088.1 TetR/AcrR family transcriptional regulator [Vibrio sp. SCSIO 43145]USD70654.1 TetR/AcrR family transcriptional regulator [Vibrio sp. SCSIO 43139]